MFDPSIRDRYTQEDADLINYFLSLASGVYVYVYKYVFTS